MSVEGAVMIQLDAPDPLQTPSLSFAARMGNAEAVRKLLKEGRRPDSVDNRGWTPLHEAAAAGHVTCAELLLHHEQDIKDLKTHEGETALFLSVNQVSNLAIVKLLLDHSANVNLGNNELVTPLYKACELDLVECARLLLDSGADVNAADAGDNRPLHEAINRRSAKMIYLLLEHGADVAVKNSYGLTPLMSAAIIGFYEVIKKLYNPEVLDINEREMSGHTALMMAAQGGCLETTKALLEMGADPNIVSDDGHQTALHLAAHGDDPRLVQFLIPVTDLENVARCTNISPIILAIDSMQVKSIELLLEWINGHSYMLRKVIDCQSETLHEMYRVIGAVSYLLFHKAELEEVLPVLKLLLRHGFPVNALSKYEVPPLAAITASSAPRGIKKVCIEILLDHGSDIDQPCPRHKLSSLPAALYYACYLHPGESWLMRFLMSVSRKCNPDTLLSIVSNVTLEGGEQRLSKAMLQRMLDVVLELGFSDNLAMLRIWRFFRRSSGPIGGSVSRQQMRQSGYDLHVPEVLTPAPLSKLCRIVVRRHYHQSDLKKYSLPRIIHDFLNYAF